jgi:hypothetical protein
MQGQPWIAPAETNPEPATKPKSRPGRRSDPLIANWRIERLKVPDRRSHRDQWIAPTENATLLAARTNITPCQITQHPLNHARM